MLTARIVEEDFTRIYTRNLFIHVEYNQLSTYHSEGIEKTLQNTHNVAQTVFPSTFSFRESRTDV